MFNYLWLALGGALGTVGRFWISSTVASRWGVTFPLGTLLVNLSGSFLIGAIDGFTRPEGRFVLQPLLRQFFMIGLCGGYTTFSSFSLETLNLAQDGEWFLAGMNVLLSVFLCLMGIWMGRIFAMAFSTK